MRNGDQRSDDDKVICKISPSVEVDRDEWTITFSSNLYDFLKERVGDVHLWVDQQYNLIVKGRLKFAQSIMNRVVRGEKLSQRAIGNLIRAYGMTLWLDSLDF